MVRTQSICGVPKCQLKRPSLHHQRSPHASTATKISMTNNDPRAGAHGSMGSCKKLKNRARRRAYYREQPYTSMLQKLVLYLNDLPVLFTSLLKQAMWWTENTRSSSGDLPRSGHAENECSKMPTRKTQSRGKDDPGLLACFRRQIPTFRDKPVRCSQASTTQKTVSVPQTEDTARL